MEKEARQAKAVELHGQYLNCCQCVLVSCTDLTGMDAETAEAVGMCFGNGMGSGEVCGAISGGLMALGACLPESDSKEKYRTARHLGKQLQQRFREQLGSVLCREILREHKGKICDTCIACSVGIVHELAEQMRKEEEQ